MPCCFGGNRKLQMANMVANCIEIMNPESICQLQFDIELLYCFNYRICNRATHNDIRYFSLFMYVRPDLAVEYPQVSYADICCVYHRLSSSRIQVGCSQLVMNGLGHVMIHKWCAAELINYREIWAASFCHPAGPITEEGLR